MVYVYLDRVNYESMTSIMSVPIKWPVGKQWEENRDSNGYDEYVTRDQSQWGSENRWNADLKYVENCMW